MQLAHVRDQPVYLNISGIGGLRRYGLNLFNTSIPILADEDQSVIKARQLAARAVSEATPGYNPDILEPDDAPVTIFNGFWQCEKYFSDVSQQLREEFTLAKPPAPGGPSRLVLQRVNSVCLHVRLDDYLRLEGSFMGFVGIDYYKRAIAEMVKRVPDAHFFVFSDDLGWCMETLQIDHPHTFVNYDPGPDKAAWTLSLMSHCTHFVISNSTFAWWAAWLGKAAEKIVIAPQGWFAPERSASEAARLGPLCSMDVIPAGWMRV
jgi:hypothetical protein